MRPSGFNEGLWGWEVIEFTIRGNVPSKSNGYKIVTFTPKGGPPRSSMAKTDLLKKYEDSFYIQIPPGARQHIDSELTVRLRVYYDSWRPDLDGSFKVVLDCLQEAKVIENDRQVHKLIAEKFKDQNNPRVEITLTGYVDVNAPSLFPATRGELLAWAEENAPPQILAAIQEGVEVEEQL